MSLAIDCTILAIIGLFIFIGYKQGLIKLALKILTFLIAIIISMFLYKPIANFIINNTNIDENIQTAMIEKILPEGQNEKYIISEELSMTIPIIDTADKTITQIIDSLADKMIEVGTFFVLFILSKIILMFVTILSTLITKLPIIKQLDKTGGVIYGLIKGLFIVCFIFAIISLISPLLPISYIDIIKNTFIGNLFYEYNFLLILLSL